MTIDCPYCGVSSELVGGESIYPHRKDLYKKNFYLCVPCNAYVGCHPRTKIPLGRIANKQLRECKMLAHACFDPIWKTKKMTRSDAYILLASKLNIDNKECHIGMFDMHMCKKVISIISLGEFYR